MVVYKTFHTTTDNGETFYEIFTYEKKESPSIQLDFNELIYKRETKEIFAINTDQIIGYNLNTRTKKIEYTSKLGLVDVASVYENNKTYFIIIENTDELSNSKTSVYYTNDFKTKTDITNKLTTVQSTSFYRPNYGDITYKYNFQYVAATSLNNIYITNWSYQEYSTIKPYPYTIDGVIRYHDNEARYLFGNPFKDHNTLTTRNWADGNTFAYGIAASPQNEDEFLFTTLCGMVYSPDNIHLYPKYSTVTEGVYPNAKYVTNGIDEQGTYGVIEDPFHEDVLLLLNTDLGLIRSEDNGKSWARANDGIPNIWVNTVYDASFDKRRENYVYSIWSGRHNAPYTPNNETDNRNGGFAISKDGGKTWDATYSSGLPKNVVPVKMSVIYPKDSMEATIYVATFNEGFFVSYDSGKTFTPMNNGITRVSYKNEEGYQYILAADIEVKEGRIFGITAKNSYSNKETQAGELFEYKNGQWQKITLPKNVKTPRDIYYHNGILYITGTATAIWEYKNGTDFTNYGGGVYAYQNGTFTQIFDEHLSTTSTVIDSKGTLYVSDINGNIYRKEINKDYQKIYDSYFYISKGLQISNDDDYLYLASFGGGLLKLENLNSLYQHVHTGKASTCAHKAVCDICGEEYGELNPIHHETSSTHIINKKNPTYEEAGYTGDIVYDCCGAIKEKGNVIPKLQLPSESKPEDKEETNNNTENPKEEVLNPSKPTNSENSNKTEIKKEDPITENNSSNEKQEPTVNEKNPPAGSTNSNNTEKNPNTNDTESNQNEKDKETNKKELNSTKEDSKSKSHDKEKTVKKVIKILPILLLIIAIIIKYKLDENNKL